MAESWNGTADQTNRSHNLPFALTSLGKMPWKKHLNICTTTIEMFLSSSRQIMIMLMTKMQLGVYLTTDYHYVLVGYIASELTKYVHLFLGTPELDVSVKRIRFCTTFYKIGFYFTIEITINRA